MPMSTISRRRFVAVFASTTATMITMVGVCSTDALARMRAWGAFEVESMTLSNAQYVVETQSEPGYARMQNPGANASGTFHSNTPLNNSELAADVTGAPTANWDVNTNNGTILPLGSLSTSGNVNLATGNVAVASDGTLPLNLGSVQLPAVNLNLPVKVNTAGLVSSDVGKITMQEGKAIAVTARGTACGGALPRMYVTVNGVRVIDTEVRAGWNNYITPYDIPSSQANSIKIELANAGGGLLCKRTLDVDWMSWGYIDSGLLNAVPIPTGNTTQRVHDIPAKLFLATNLDKDGK